MLVLRGTTNVDTINSRHDGSHSGESAVSDGSDWKCGGGG